MQDRKKIYSEQLLQIHTDSKKRNPGKEIYASEYVIELKKDCYFAGFKEGKILCQHPGVMPVYFSTSIERTV